MNIRAKYSGGPNASATPASRGAKKVSPTSPRVPATKEEMAEIPRAAPFRVPYFISGDLRSPVVPFFVALRIDAWSRSRVT